MHSTMFSRRLWNRDFVLVLLISTLASYPNSIFISLLPVYVLDLGGTNALTGLMMTGLTVLGMVTRVIVAPLIDRLGRKKLLVLGSGLYALNAVLFCFTKDLNTLFFLRVLCGFTQGVFFPVPPTMVSDIAPEDLMVGAIGFFGVSSSVTFAVAPTIGLWVYNTFGTVAMFLSAAVLGLTAFMLSFFVRDHYRRPESRGEERKPEREKTGSGLKGSLLVLILLPSAVNLFALTSKSAIDSFLTPCGLSRGLEQISLYFLVNNLTVICARLLMGRVISRFSKRACVFTGLLLAAGGTALIAVSHRMLLMLISAVLTGVGITAVTQLLQAEVMLTIPGERRGVANTAFMLAGDIGGGISVMLWGVLSASAGYTVTYLAAGGTVLFGFLFHAAYWKKRKL